MNPRLVIVPSASITSGLVSYVLGQVRVLVHLAPVVAAEPGSDLAAGLPSGVSILEVGSSTASIAAALRGSDAIVVHTHGPRALLAARRARIPSGSIHHVFHELPWRTGTRGAGEALLSLGASRITNSPVSQSRMNGLGLRVPTVLPPVLSAPEFASRALARQRLGLSPGGLFVAVVGRLHPNKAPLTALESASCLVRAYASTPELVFLGEGPLRGAIQDRAAHLGVTVHLLGSVPGASSLLRAFDAVLMPSPQESFGLALAEAAVAGVPIAAVASPGARWILEGLDSPVLSHPNPEALAAALDRALGEGHERRDLGPHILRRFGERSAACHRTYFQRALEPA